MHLQSPSHPSAPQEASETLRYIEGLLAGFLEFGPAPSYSGTSKASAEVREVDLGLGQAV